MTQLKEQVLAVTTRRAYYEEAEAYYEGLVPETFASVRLARAMRNHGGTSRLNFCRPIVEAVNNRLIIENIGGTTKAATEAIDKVWQKNELGLEAQEIHRRALEFGDCYVAVWPDEDGELLVSYNSPKNMVLVYDPENPRKKLYAVKIWLAGEAETRMNVYTADKIIKYRTNTDMPTEGSQWSVVDSVDNPFGEVPVFHFRTNRPFGRPEHLDAYSAQDAVNKLFITNMFTIDYQGAPQRYALSNLGDGEVNDFEEGDTDRENIGALKNGPGELWYLKGVQSVGEFKPADPSNFWDPIKDTVRAMASLTDTPLHYFEKTGNVPSGNALRTAEAPLLKKVRDRQESFGYAWRDLCAFILKVEGVKGDVQVYWKAVESLDELERWDVTLKKMNAGLSQQQALRENGYSPDQIDKIMAERKQEAEDGTFYARKPNVRVQEQNDETNVIQDAA